MQRTKLALASLAAGTAACLAVMYGLREPPRTAAAPAPAPATIGPARGEPDAAAAPVPAAPASPRPPIGAGPARPATLDEAQFAAEVVRSAEAREQALRDALLRVAEDGTLPLDARLERYEEAVAAARDEEVEQANAAGAPFLANPSMLAEVFLRMEPVQRELAALSPAARSRELARIRRELGFDEQGIARMEEIDASRDARWQNGLAYMEERTRIATSFEGDALDTELGALREEYFAHEAPTIEAEERDGFFRFERPRIYGRN